MAGMYALARLSLIPENTRMAKQTRTTQTENPPDRCGGHSGQQSLGGETAQETGLAAVLLGKLRFQNAHLSVKAASVKQPCVPLRQASCNSSQPFMLGSQGLFYSNTVLQIAFRRHGFSDSDSR